MKIADVINKKVTKIEASDLLGCEKLSAESFYGCAKLESLEIPYSITIIDYEVFGKCTSLYEIDSSKMNPYCIVEKNFRDTLWYTNQSENTLITMSNKKILIGNKISKPSTNLSIPSSVINLASYCLQEYGSGDSGFTSVVIPDTVEILGAYIFYSHDYLASITIGAGVRRIGNDLTPGTQTTTLIFRQPKEMVIDLPVAGDGTGIAYNKNSRAISIYTDNECIKNYDWATDNVTATFYPLADAPE